MIHDVVQKIQRFFPFILLNILISALTTLGVLWIWEQTHNLPSGGVEDPQALLMTLQTTREATPTPRLAPCG